MTLQEVRQIIEDMVGDRSVRVSVETWSHCVAQKGNRSRTTTFSCYVTRHAEVPGRSAEANTLEALIERVRHIVAPPGPGDEGDQLVEISPEPEPAQGD